MLPDRATLPATLRILVGHVLLFAPGIHAQATQPAARGGPPAVAEVGAPEGRIVLPGMLIADETVELVAKVSGYVSGINVDIGSRVRKGDVLITVDVPEMLDELRQGEAALHARRARVDALQAKAEQARLGVESARTEQSRAAAEQELSQLTFRRKQELLNGKAIPQQEYDEAKSQLSVALAKVAIAQAGVAGAGGAELAAGAEVKAAEADAALAEAEVARLKTLVGYMTIKAPFDGVIVRRGVDPGAFVRSAAQSTGMPLLVIARVDRLRLVLDVPEAQAPRVVPGTRAEAHIASLDAWSRQVSVTRTSVAIRPDTHSMRAEIDIDNRAGRLAPGMYARTVLMLSAPPSGE
jgi:multidrug resistance efflux pump